MLVALILLALPTKSYQENIPVFTQGNDNLADCAANIIRKYFSEIESLTYVDIYSDGDRFLKAINSLETVKVRVKEYDSKCSKCYNEGYVIVSDNVTSFLENFRCLNKERYWNPGRRFLIIIEKLDDDGRTLEDVFQELVKLHVINVVVINGTDSAEVYSYNPFENQGCGRYFERVISYGKCLEATANDLYPSKGKNGFVNCTIRAVVPHIPPFSLNPNLTKYRPGGPHLTGAEQYAFEILADIEQFKVEYIYNDFAEKVPMVDNDMRASEALKMIQDNKSEAVFGFTMLSRARANPFDYLYGHESMADSFLTVVRRAHTVPTWKMIYLEFSLTVWILFFVSFLSCATFVLLLVRKEDKVAMILWMWDTLLAHGSTIPSKFTIKLILTVWVWFSYLVNSFYQSSLTSLTTNPGLEYQVQSEEDLVKFGFKPCISPVFREYLNFVADDQFLQDSHECKSIIRSLEVVSETDGIYTIMPSSLYEFNKYRFYDPRGVLKMYYFEKPMSKIMYATYLYKGFPLAKQWQTYMLRLRETGITTRYSSKLYYEEMLQHTQNIDKSFRHRFILPWYILVFGFSISTVVFLIEMFGKKISEKCSLRF